MSALRFRRQVFVDEGRRRL